MPLFHTQSHVHTYTRTYANTCSVILDKFLIIAGPQLTNLYNKHNLYNLHNKRLDNYV